MVSYQITSLGSAISPLSALAAAVSGEERYINPPAPILPLKLRLDVERHVSPSHITPIWAPRHGPHPGGAIMAPALRLSLIHISEPTRLRRISYAVFCLKKKKKKN